MMLLVPDNGSLMELFLYKVDIEAEMRKRDLTRLVTVSLNRDDTKAGTVTFSLDGPTNDRATKITGMLCGSYVRVQGLAAFDVSEAQAVKIMQEV